MLEDDLVDRTQGSVTPFLRLDEVLLGHATDLRAALGDNFIGLYPIGSLVIGDFDLTSDVDFSVVTAHEMSDSDVERVQRIHTELVGRDSRWVRHLEYSFISMTELHRMSSPYGPGGERILTPERDLWYFGNGAATIHRSDHDNTVVTRWTLRYASGAVVGPQPVSFAPAISTTELSQEIRTSLIGWAHLVRRNPSQFDNRFHQVFLVLNDCRALQDLHEGRITSKWAGVNWAKRNLDVGWHALIDYCWRERQDTTIHISQPADQAAYQQTIEFMTYAAELAERFESSP